jgi:hypothetical protein
MHARSDVDGYHDLFYKYGPPVEAVGRMKRGK